MASQPAAKEQAFAVGKNIQCGSVSKPHDGTLVVNFPQAFTQTPVVVLTPYWALQSNPSGSIETVVAVTAENFTLSSHNYGLNYFVNWIACAPGT